MHFKTENFNSNLSDCSYKYSPQQNAQQTNNDSVLLSENEENLPILEDI